MEKGIGERMGKMRVKERRIRGRMGTERKRENERQKRRVNER